MHEFAAAQAGVRRLIVEPATQAIDIGERAAAIGLERQFAEQITECIAQSIRQSIPKHLIRFIVSLDSSYARLLLLFQPKDD